MEARGLITYLGIEEWWDSLPQADRDELRGVYTNALGSSGKYLDEGQTVRSSKTKGALYYDLARYTRNSELRNQLYLMAEEEAKKTADVVGDHFVIMDKWGRIKKELKTNNTLAEEYEDLLIMDIKLYDAFHEKCLNGAFGYVLGEPAVPTYPAYKELVLFYERTGRLQEAIDVVDEAMNKNVRETTSFEGRKMKLLKKLEKQSHVSK